MGDHVMSFRRSSKMFYGKILFNGKVVFA